MPALNTYIPDSLTLTKPSREFKKPQPVVDHPGLRVLYMPSCYFADEPKDDVIVILRNAKAINSARNQVLFSLTDYLASIALDQLSYQASVVGLSFSISLNNGLMINANVFIKRLVATVKLAD